MGKNSVLGLTIFAMVLPISVFYVDFNGLDATWVIGLFYAYFRVSAGFGPVTVSADEYGILEYPDVGYTERSFFSVDAWKEVWGADDGQTMMILWAATLALVALGFLITFFDPKTGGIFLILAAIAGFAFTLMGYTVLDDNLGGAATIYPIPIGALFLLIAGLIGLRTEEF
jgi:hypothetical protein